MNDFLAAWQGIFGPETDQPKVENRVFGPFGTSSCPSRTFGVFPERPGPRLSSTGYVLLSLSDWVKPTLNIIYSWKWLGDTKKCLSSFEAGVRMSSSSKREDSKEEKLLQCSRRGDLPGVLVSRVCLWLFKETLCPVPLSNDEAMRLRWEQIFATKICQIARNGSSRQSHFLLNIPYHN